MVGVLSMRHAFRYQDHMERRDDGGMEVEKGQVDGRVERCGN